MIFRNEYYFLSNMYPCTIKVRDPQNGKVYTFSCAESLFQAFKNRDFETFQKLNGFEAKKAGRRVALRADWDDIKDDVMEFVLRTKFHDNDLMSKLKNVTGYIQEDNSWNDRYWGVCRGKGSNKLGLLLMKIRDEG